MDTYTLVRTEHLNHHGFLFGGQFLKWVDEHAWMVAARDFPGSFLVTRAMDDIEFKTPVANGSILRFHILPWKQGTSSITYAVEAYSDEPGEQSERFVFSTHVTFVSVDEDGKKKPLPPKKRYRSEIAFA